MSQTIDQILKKNQQTAEAEQPTHEEQKCYSNLSGEGLEENFLELRFRDGIRTCFPYQSLSFFNFDPEMAVIDAEFGGFLVTLHGRGLDGKLFHHLKSKRVAWVQEADSDLEDHDQTETYISEITITPPDGFSGEDEEPPEETEQAS